MNPDDHRLFHNDFPRSNAYNPEWVVAGASGANALWLCEWLTDALDLRSDMRILDLGCGRASSSIFLHREFGCEVWAADLWFSAAGNNDRIRDAGYDGRIFPVHADARSLPFARGFFDAIISIDSFVYYGTDDLYLGNIARFLKPGGTLAIAGAGLTHEIQVVPQPLADWWTPDVWCLHSAEWWRRHWSKTGIVNVELADDMRDGWQRWLDWQNIVSPNNEVEISAVEGDAGKTLAYVRCIARLNPGVELDDPIVSIPNSYTKTQLLRDVEDV